MMSSSDPTSRSRSDHPATAPALSQGTGGHASQLFPVADVTAAIAAYLTTQPPQPQTCTTSLASIDTSQPSPRQHSFADAHQWPPRDQHHPTPSAAAWLFAPPPPPSVSSWTVRGAQFRALALVAAGANGETRRELLGFLGTASLDELQRAAATKLTGALRGLPQASFACGVWVDKRWALRPEFADAARAAYSAVAESVDFVSQPEQERQRVNAFVSDATNGLIAVLLPPGSVDSFTVVVLANALYFKGSWAQPFDPSRTFHAPFHLPDGGTVRAPFMTSSFEQQVAVFPGFSSLKLPYTCKDGDHWNQAAWFYMLILLPDGKALNIADLYDKAISTPGFIRKHTPSGKVPVGRFMVPKFKFTFEFEASEEMQKLGVTRAFRDGDFSGMVTGGDGLSVKGVYHKATVEVDEEGTVAAVRLSEREERDPARGFHCGPAVLVRRRRGEDRRRAVLWSCGESSGGGVMSKSTSQFFT
ncbi:hypothetical protein EJB05_32289, partial [Eragrostis curvula]